MKHQIFALQSVAPQFYQFFSYQFMHESWTHLLSNMLFLWVFGNSVNGKMGHGPYLLFYLAGGVFAGWGNSLFSPNSLIGASGAIAAVTTAYLALFPRSHVTVLVWLFIFIQFFELPAMLIIVIKVILWDNIISRGMGEGDNIAYNAHLAGYLFGFTATLLMLLVRALPRDQFDILAVWRRWHQRGGLAHVFGAGPTPEQYTYGKVARTPVADPEERAAEDRYVNEVAELRVKIVAALEAGNLAVGADIYQKLVALAPTQCMSEREQLQIARELYRQSHFEQAAFAFERFLECYRDSDEAGNVRLLLGIIYARDLRQFEAADKHLTQSMVSLRDQGRRGQCLQWLKDVRAALGRPAPDIMNG
ncbi:MAG: rhomboid family intramembrane serine protease [Planctomycetes bacterium]|nr:rhomboid family intramembrane serine protease [Planctomycetota bacterium]MBI3832965.1 rhomboid family intramembrane serine protease [Planctomycetota bacterium]